MSHARVEELSDSDPEIDDPSSYLPDSDLSIIRPADLPPPTSTSTFRPPPPSTPQTTLRPVGPSQQAQQQSRETIKPYCSIYPIYFSSTRTRATGRRVSKALATPNPLAYTILHALPGIFGAHPLPTAFEPDKMHPKDWSNPGRVRVQLFDKDTHEPLHPTLRNKSHLFILIAKYLQAHPTMKDDPLKLQVQGLTVPEGGLPPPAVPRGWKVNSVLPLHSPAMSGGGVSDNFFKEAMEELRQAQMEQGGSGGAGAGAGAGAGGMQLPPTMQGLASMMGESSGSGGGGGAPKKKKEKKKG